MAKKSSAGSFINSIFKLGKAINKDVKSAKREREKAERAKQAAQKRVEAAERAAAKRVDTFSSWGIETNQVFEYVGDIERKVIVYDGEPLLGLNAGDEFELQVFLGDGKMYSRFSDWNQSTKDSNDAIVMYEGCPIGFGWLSVKSVKELAKKGVALRLKGVCKGDLDGYAGIKEIVFMVPFERLWADDILELIAVRDAGGPENCPVLEYNEWDEDDFVQIATRKKWLFKDARLEIIQPEKSNAKPRVAVYSGKKMVSKVEPKNRTYYNEIMEIAQNGEQVIVSARRCEGAEEKDYYHIKIYHWGA